MRTWSFGGGRHGGLAGMALAVALASGAVAAEAPKIGVLLKDKSPGFWTFVEQGAIETGAALNAELTIKAPPTVLDVGAQPRLLAALAAGAPDALVIGPTNPEAVNAAVAELAAKGVKIVAVDTPLADGIAQVFVGADQAAMGEAAAQVFVGLVNEGDEVAMLRNNSLDRTVLVREQKLREAMQGRPGVVLHAEIFASSEKDSEEDQALLLLTKHPTVKVIFASATRGTMASIKAVRAKGLVGKVKVVGFGTYLPPEAAQAFEDDILYGWIAQQPKDLGVKAVQSAVALVKGDAVPSVVRPEFKLVTRENFRAADVQALRQP